MNELTPYELIENALDSIHRAAALIGGRENNSITFSAIEKAALLLEKVVPVLSDITIQNTDQESQTFIYMPQVLDVEAMLKPIPGDNPVGINARLSGEVNNLLSYVVNRTRATDFRPQYFELLTKAKQLLIERSKDLGVAVRLIEAATDESGFRAVADGLFLINGLFSNFWDGLYPESEDGDCEARANELTKLEELLLARLNARYGQPHEYSPTCVDLNEAEQEVAVFKAIMEQFDILDKTTDERFDDQAPDLNELRSFLRMFQSRIDAQCTAFKQSISQEQDAQKWEREQAVAVVMDAVDRETERQQTISETPDTGIISLEPKNLDDAIGRINSCAKFIVNNAPQDPLGYIVNRSCKWFSRIPNASSGSVPEERKRKIMEAFSSQQWEELLRESEAVFSEGGHRWLDLQRYQAVAAQGLGSGYETVARFIISAVVDFAADNRKLLDETMEDGTPCSSPETTEWIRMEIANRGNLQSGEGFGGKSDAFFNSEIQRANDLADKGRSGAGMNLLHSRLQQASSSRERFLWRLTLAEYCIRNGLTEIGLAAIDNLLETIDKSKLDEWEDTGLFARVYKIGYTGYRSLGEKRAPKEKIEYFYRRICLYDPKYTIASEN
ncbi:MAG TPA: type VI secretion system domain-containing protein [Chitinispirillaceae bacterium]|nr:type VI secretion system domain-containing protein [Chitinispirillaceae bacterium]